MAEKAVRKERDLVAELIQARAVKKSLSDGLTEANKKCEALEAELVDVLTEEGKDRTSSYEDMGGFTVMKPRAYATMTEEGKEELFKFLRGRKRGDLIIQTVMSGSLSTFVKEMLEEGREIPECISYYLKTSLHYFKPKEE